MAVFKKYDTRKHSLKEEEISSFWEEKNILDLTINNREGCPNFVFYDGPATANAMPGLHHLMGKLLKDTICKYKTMKGFRVLRKVGWDTHGLPVETGVEKNLGFSSKLDIEKYGIKEFNEKCKESVWENEKAFSLITKKMGQFIDLDNPYVTYDNNYIETEWWILKKFFDEGLIYEGHKILPFCTRCGTGLSSHEVAQGYKDVSVETVYVPLKLINMDAYLLIWTTTPWTLLSNVAVAVNPKEEYVLIKSLNNKFIVASSLVSKIFDEYEIIKKYKGSELEYMEYEQLLPFISPDKKSFYVTLADYVSMEDGTGIVHIAPAFGADDYEIGKKYDLPFFNPVNEEGKYTEGPWKNISVFEADKEIIVYLKENGKLFKKQKINHNYPHCWRCDNPLLYYSKPSWYIEVTKLKEKLIENNDGVNWFPDYVGEKRFGNWLTNVNDWALSRNRYWGTPLNIWKCPCGHLESIGSIEELVSKSIEKIDTNIELHRPFVDDIHILCSKCSNIMNRTPEVIDCWFDSGSMPFSQYHYPFENKELWETQFPADFIAEGIDQTRGWFYTLLVISTFVTGKTPYKNVLVNELLLDKFGHKMSKSKGNGINPFDLIDEYGADAVRWYLLFTSPTWTPTKVDIDGIKEIQSKFFNTLTNTYTFFSLYANTDNIDPREFSVPIKNRAFIDKWLLSKYNKLIKEVNATTDVYDLNKAVHLISDFVNDDLSNWYIRRNRRRFWASELDDDKMSVYNTTYEVLLGLTKLLSIFIPFISEELYRSLTNELSVHLEDYPLCDESLIDDAIEERMDLVIKLVSLGRNAREASLIKVRQPISEVLIDKSLKSVIGDLDSLIKEELNVKEIKFINNLSEYINFEVKPNFKVAGPIFGSEIKHFSEFLLGVDDKFIKLLEEGEMEISVNNNTYKISKEMLDIRVKSKAGFNSAMQNNIFIILNTELSDELLDEGIARELISKIQQLRKSNDYEVMDKINIFFLADDKIMRVIKDYEDFILKETLGENILFTEKISDSYDINGNDVNIKLEKIS